MKTNYLKTLGMIMIMGLVFQSCSKDDQAITEETTEDFTGGQNGHGGNDSNHNNVDQINNNVMNDWIDLLLELERHAGGMRPNASARALAYINLAAYETAQPGMRGHVSNQNRLQGLKIDRKELPKKVNWQLALNACYADVIDHFLINVPEAMKPRIGRLEQTKNQLLSPGVSNKTVAFSKYWGVYVAEQVIKYSQTDVYAEEQILDPQPTSYEPPTGDGYWTYSADPERALFPYWESVRTFVVSPEETTTLPPIPYSTNVNSLYFAEMKDVYEKNNEAKEEQNDQLWVAEFWSDDVEGLMMSPPARQISIANQLIDKYKLNLEESLTLFVKVGFALNDAAVSTWKYKYEHMVMRPSVYIHDNIDVDYQTNLYRLIYWPDPSFPGYPSGHSCFASAAGGVFINFFGNNTNFTERSHAGRTEFLGAPRKFSSFKQMARENAFSRIPLGVHINMDCAEGLRLGYEISDAINDLELEKRPG
ncbi:MAG: hypothetical protein ACJATI_005290 [Halioglobus sp.]|jgi:hypothetical protein